jgi:hypothetical protein
MPSIGRMCYLTTVAGSFHGRVLAARLGAEGVLVMLKGTTDGPYPLPSAVDVLVPSDQLKLAREILLADAVDDAFSEVDLDDVPEVEAVAGASRSGDVGAWIDGALTGLPSGGPSDGFALGLRSDARGDRRQSSRLRGVSAALVVLLAATLIVVACLATAAAH